MIITKRSCDINQLFFFELFLIFVIITSFNFKRTFCFNVFAPFFLMSLFNFLLIYFFKILILYNVQSHDFNHYNTIKWLLNIIILQYLNKNLRAILLTFSNSQDKAVYLTIETIFVLSSRLKIKKLFSFDLIIIDDLKHYDKINLY